MRGDKLIIEFQGLRLGINTSIIAGIVEMDALPFLPGQKGLVSGIISLKNEPVVVADLPAAFERTEALPRQRPHKVIIISQGGKTLGLDAGRGALTFLWNEDISAGPKTEKQENPLKYADEIIETTRGRVLIINWRLIFEEAARILSTHGAGI